MKLVTTFHQSSAIHASVKCRLASRDLEHLVVAKSNNLQVYSIQPEGLILECTLEIWGRVLALRALPIQNSARSNLVVLLDHPSPELIFLSYTESVSGTGELSVTKSMSLRERLPRPAEFFNDLVLDPTGRILLVSCYTGRLKVVVLESAKYSQDFDVTLPELNVFSITFLPVDDALEYTIVILHMDHQERLTIVARELSVDGLELHPEPSNLLPRTILSPNQFPTSTLHVPKLVAVPPLTISGEGEETAFTGGVLVIGGRRIQLYETAPPAWQEKARGKAKRLEKKKHGSNPAMIAEAKEKERAREGKKRKPRAAIEWPWSDVSAICEVENQSQYLIADGYGRLAMLFLGLLDKQGLILLPLGEVSPPTALTYLTSQVLFVGSYLGDSQLVHISPSPLAQRAELILPIPANITTAPQSILTSGASTSVYTGKGKKRALDGGDRSSHPEEDVDMDGAAQDREYHLQAQAKKDAIEKGCIIANTDVHLEVLDVWQNIAPINDAILVDLDGNGQKQAVTCSGGKSTGSLNVVRNGADFRELSVITGLENIVDIFAFKLRFEASDMTHVAISTSSATHVFEFIDKSLRLLQQSSHGFIVDEPTLALSNIAARVKTPSSSSTYGDSSHIIQVTARGVHLLDYDRTLRQWILQEKMTFPREIVAADINPSQIFVAHQGGKISVVNVPPGASLHSVERPTQYAEREVSAICCIPLGGNKYFTKFVAIAYWQDSSIEVYQLTPNELKLMSKTEVLPSAVHSIILHNFGTESSGDHPYLLAGLGDGSVVTFAWADKGRTLKDKTVVSLGLDPVNLSLCDVDGQVAVFATGSQATVISWDGRRLRDSPIMLKNVVAASRFSADGYRSSLILATQTSLIFGIVKDLNKLHIRSIPLGLQIPQRIIHDSSMKVVGVVCTCTTPVRIGEAEMPTSSFKLLDEISFESICEFPCEPTEELTAAVKMRQINDGKIMSIYCLGSLRYRPAELEASSGRLIALTASHEQSKLQISVLAVEEVGGCVYAVTVVGDLIAAAVNSSVMLYKLEESEESSAPSYTLKKLDEWNHNYFVTSLVAFNNQLLLGDHISSISLVRVEDEKLRLVTKDYAPLWPVSVEASTIDTIIGANDTNNLFSYSVCRSPRKTTLERDGLFHLGELVTKFIRGPLLIPDTSSNVAIKPEYVYMTSSGRIGVIVDVLDNNLATHLSALQRNLAYLRKGPGESTLAQYRAPKNARGNSDGEASFGFLDGDFLEQFLTYLTSPEDMQKIVRGTQNAEQLKISIDETKRVLETLQAMH